MLDTFDKRAVSSSLNRRMEVKNGKHNKKLQLNIPCIGGSPGVFHPFAPYIKSYIFHILERLLQLQIPSRPCRGYGREKRWTSKK